jgi:hypothetical protein
MAKPDYVLVTLYAILTALIITLIILATPLIVAQFKEKPADIQEIINSCSNMSMIDASSCVAGITNGFYKYNFDNVGTELTFNELVEEGGVCSNWSDYYSELGASLGYNTENIVIKIDEGFYHEFSVWSSKEQYCVIDQTEVSCFEFGNFRTLE